MKNWSVLAKSVLAVVGNIAVAVTPVSPEPSPWNDPLNDPEWDNPEAPVVATMFPVPLIAVVVRLPAVPPPITTWFAVKPSTCTFAKFYYKYVFY
jgi:hypothetical protein